MITKLPHNISDAILTQYRNIREPYTIFTQNSFEQKEFIAKLRNESTRKILLASFSYYKKQFDLNDLVFFDHTGRPIGLKLLNQGDIFCGLSEINNTETVLFQLPEHCTTFLFDQLMACIKKGLGREYDSKVKWFTFITNQLSPQQARENDIINDSFIHSSYYKSICPHEFNLLTDAHPNPDLWALSEVRDDVYTYGLQHVFKNMFYCGI
jgi:hypothetical protein